MSTPGLIGRSAVVIGAGMAGLAAARAVADSFEQVVVLERDCLPESAVSRPGTPHARHVHVMLAGGLRALGELVPGFGSALLSAGAAPLLAHDIRWELPGYDPFPARDFGLRACSMSRSLIELTLRRQISRHPRITLRQGCRVLRLLDGPDRSSIEAVSYETMDGVEKRSADLVVDASGRGMPTLAYLQTSTGTLPRETSIGVDIGYSTTEFEMPDDPPSDWAGVITFPEVPSSARRGLLMPIEGNRWLVGLSGRRNDKPPGDWDGYLNFAQKLRTPTIYRAIRRARRAGPIARFRFPASVRRYFDSVDQFPRGLLPIGDALCRFNPIWGQGMSVAAQQASALRNLLAARSSAPDPLGGLARSFFAVAAPIVDAPWQLAAVPDFAYPETEGERPPDFERTLRFGAALHRLAATDAEVHRLTFEVQHLLRPATALNEPSLVERVMQLV